MNYATRGKSMGAAQKIDVEDFDEVFSNIAKLYDHAENIIKIAYDESVPDQEQFIHEIESLVAQIEESANILASDVSKVVETGQEPTSIMKMRVNTALRKILITIDEYRKHANI